MFLGATQVAFAYNTFGDHVLNGGVGNYGYSNRYYYVTTSASGYSSLIHKAMDSWIYTTERLSITTPISYVQTSTQSSSVMDIYAGNYYSSDTGIIAQTTFWVYSTQLDPYKSNWGWNKIQLNMPVMSTLDTYDQQGSIAHEMGHAFGLDHNNEDPTTIMCQLAYGRFVYMPTPDDLNGINHLY